MKKILFGLTVLAFFILLFSHPDIVTSGCTRGLTLWYSSVLPSLLPFMILSSLLIQTGVIQYLNRLYAPFLGRLFRISDDGCYAMILGFLCGFPMGAKVIADLVRDEHISTKEGEYLLGFCNNVSPAFFLNYVCLLKLGCLTVPWKLVFLFYAFPILYGLITRPFYHFTYRASHIQKQVSSHRITFPMLDTCIMDSFTTITRLGGYIMLFTILVQLLRLFPMPDTTLALLSGALEISCGIDQMAALSLPSVLKTALLCTCASFGGFCICAQTQSVLDGTSLHVTTWLRGRILTSLLVLFLLQVPPVVSVLHGYW